MVIEVDGGIHKQQKEYDDGRTVELERYGITIIRFTNEEVTNDLDKVIDRIKEMVEQLKPLNPLKGT